MLGIELPAQRQMVPCTQQDKKLGQEARKAEFGPDVMKSDSLGDIQGHHQLAPTGARLRHEQDSDILAAGLQSAGKARP